MSKYDDAKSLRRILQKCSAYEDIECCLRLERRNGGVFQANVQKGI